MIEIFIFSFLVALTGALSPGPVLTFTIYKSFKEERGYLAGLFITLGHATLEFFLILLLLLGASLFFRNLLVLTLIGIVGGILLILFGLMVLIDLKKNPVDVNIDMIKEGEISGYKGNSFLGGIVMSLSNPYWTLWWALIGLSFMINFGITSFNNPMALFLFYLGHELGDLAWFWPISIFAYFGGKSLNPKIFKYILISCSIFMICFGIYLATNIILFPPIYEIV